VKLLKVKRLERLLRTFAEFTFANRASQSQLIMCNVVLMEICGVSLFFYSFWQQEEWGEESFIDNVVYRILLR